MADALRLITSPLPVASGLGYAALSAAVAADALARRSWAAGRPASLIVPALAGDLGGRVSFDNELVRTGHDRTTLSPDDLAERARAFAEARRAEAAETLTSFGVAAELDEGTAADTVRRAAAVAFVRLHDEGLIHMADVVVPHCPSCKTVIEGPDAVRGELDASLVEIVVDDDLDLRVRTFATELLHGAVAVGVPIGHPSAGARVALPVTGREVPVVAEPGRTEPGLLAPAHDADAHELARLHGFVPVPVLSPDGVVLGDDPFGGGLTRFAARQATTALLEAEGVVASVEDALEPVERCRQCGSVAVPVLGPHWVLRVSQLEVAAADAIRHGEVGFVPADMRDAVLAVAGAEARPWCLDRTVPGGVPLPVATCGDCGRTSVDVEASPTCGKCFGVLDPSTTTLDPRFVGAVWPLATLGWPARGRGTVDASSAEQTTAVVPPGALESWALPALALGVHLAGLVPFASVVVQPPTAVPDATAPDGAADTRAARLALLSTIDVDAASTAVRALDEPDGDDPDVIVAVEGAVAALDDGGPGRAAALLVAALTTGVPAAAADRARALAVPFLGA
ncbi:MAG TPA: class I tRNA ligase family protein [Acidimicrobiales bacterium]